MVQVLKGSKNLLKRLRTFRTKILEVLKESYFARTTNESSKEISKAQTLSEGVDSTVAPVAGGMDAYVRALGNFKPQS